MASSPFCLAFHPLHPHLLAVGLHCGRYRPRKAREPSMACSRLAIFNLQRDREKPFHVTDPSSGQHRDPVWAVAWHHEQVSHESDRHWMEEAKYMFLL